MAAAKKPAVIRNIFLSRWDARKRRLSNPVVTLEDVTAAIVQYNSTVPPALQLSPKNPANFMKDIVRVTSSANRNWPSEVLACGYTARQMTGGNNCFEFIPLPKGQTEAFPESDVLSPTEETVVHLVESVSMPLASRRMGRTDESWLLQVVVKLRITETHLSLFSGLEFVQIDLLQMGIKQKNNEIDALFLAVQGTIEDNFEALVTMEAKGRKDDILISQIVGQVKGVFKMRGVTQDVVIPTAAKNIGNSRIYFVQFEAVRREDAENLETVEMQSETVFQLRPPVPGIA